MVVVLDEGVEGIPRGRGGIGVTVRSYIYFGGLAPSVALHFD
jgi:hypothetical protein